MARESAADQARIVDVENISFRVRASVAARNVVLIPDRVDGGSIYP